MHSATGSESLNLYISKQVLAFYPMKHTRTCWIFLFSFVLIAILSAGCSVSKNYNPDKKYSPAELKQDFVLMRTILEKKHPSLYWYTPKDSMDAYFDDGLHAIKDSMTELQFGWKVLAPTLHHVRCGHTSFAMSRDWSKFIKNRRIPSMPLYFKVWSDTLVITANLNRKDSLLKKGMIVTSINGMRNSEMIRKMLTFLVQDGYAYNVNYQRLSSNFPYFHRNVFGIYKNYSVTYLDRLGKERSVSIPWYNPAPDSIKKTGLISKLPKLPKPKKETREEKLQNYRSLKIDSTTALMTLNTFSNGKLRRFFRKSFREMRQRGVKDFILDIRSNGGGKINNYVLLAKYISKSPFKVADTAVAAVNGLGPYTNYISSGFWNNIGLKFFTHKKKDGRYHFGYWERHFVNPKKRNHFDGKVYVLINGLTFSASTLFCNTVKGQENVKLIGEETGGGWFGNSGVMIPDINLPNTHLRVRLPLFRLVNYQHSIVKGTGIPPDIYVPATLENIRNEKDGKMVLVNKMINDGD